MRKWTAVLLLAALMAGSSGALATTPPVSFLDGVILETLEDGSFLLQSASMGEALVLTAETTVWEGLDKPVAGAYVTVAYDGVMTKSLPPQLTAEKVSCYQLEGVVLEAELPSEIILVDTLGFGPVLVRLPEMDILPEAGDFVLVYYTGVMTMSLPGQVTGMKVMILETEEGVLTEAGEDHFLMEGTNGPVRVNIDSTSRIPDQLAEGDTVKVYYSGISTRSIPPQIFGLAVVKVMGD